MVSLLIERTADGSLQFTIDYGDGRMDKPYGTTLTDESVHSELATLGWYRVGPAPRDSLAGVYAKHRGEVLIADRADFGWMHK